MNKEWQKYVKSGAYARKLENLRKRPLDDEENENDPRPGPSNVVTRAECEEIYEDYEFLDDDSSSSDIEDAYYSHDEGVNESEDDADSDCSQNDPESLLSFLKDWGQDISRDKLKALLAQLSKHHLEIPKDPRTLFKTSRTPPVLRAIAGGLYWHYGLETCLRCDFNKLNGDREISINVNIDGLPLFNNGRQQVWPILANIFEEPNLKPFAIGVFHGDSKPESAEEFLQEFVDELRQILSDGIVINGFKLSVKFRALICDTPARAFIKGCVACNSYNGCIKCTVVQERVEGTRLRTYPVEPAPLRTDTSFRTREDPAHHKKTKGKNGQFLRTPLTDLPIDLVEDVIVGDSLHLLHLGVMKTLLTSYKDGHTYQKKWPEPTLQEVEKTMKKIRLPREIHRQIRSINDLCHYKGTELASFLNYVGVAVLKNFINPSHYQNFLRLFCAVTICSHNHYKSMLPQAQTLFQEFMQNHNELFKSVSSNFHNIVHIPREVARFGPLHTISTYPFENYLFHLKKIVRSGRKTLAQIALRIQERSLFNRWIKVAGNFPYVKDNINSTTNYSTIHLRQGVSLKAQDYANKWFLTDKHKIFAFSHASDDSKVHGTELLSYGSYFDSPMLASDINVYSTQNDEQFKDNACSFNVKEIFCKLVAVPIRDETVFVPLHHTIIDS